MISNEKYFGEWFAIVGSYIKYAFSMVLIWHTKEDILLFNFSD